MSAFEGKTGYRGNETYPIIHRDEYDVVVAGLQKALRIIKGSFVTNEEPATMNIHKHWSPPLTTMLIDRFWHYHIQEQTVLAFGQGRVANRNDRTIRNIAVVPVPGRRGGLWAYGCLSTIQWTISMLLQRRLWVTKSELPQRRSSVSNVGVIVVSPCFLHSTVSPAMHINFLRFPARQQAYIVGCWYICCVAEINWWKLIDGLARYGKG